MNVIVTSAGRLIVDKFDKQSLERERRALLAKVVSHCNATDADRKRLDDIDRKLYGFGRSDPPLDGDERLYFYEG